MTDPKKNQDHPLSDSLAGITGGASLLGRAPLTGQRHNTQSQLLHSQLAPNSLIAASAPLFLIGSELSRSKTTPDMEKLQQILTHEMKTFENRAHQLEQPTQIILAARYLLCCYLDELILQSFEEFKTNWQNDSLLQTFQHEKWGGERFFIILDRAAEDPARYIDLLELGFLCLNIGYQGKFHNENNPDAHAQFLDNLYGLIRQQRGDFPRQLLITLKKHQPHKPLRLRLPSIWLTAITTVIILAGIYSQYFFHTKEISEPLHQRLQLLNKTKTVLSSKYIQFLRMSQKTL